MAAVTAGGNLAYWQADPAEARRRYEEELQIARRLEDPVAEADAVFNLLHIAFVDSGDAELVAGLLDEAREKFESIGDARGVARCDCARGIMLMTLGRPDEASGIFRELLPRFEELGDVRWIIRGLIESHRMRDAATTTIGMQEGIVIARALDRPDVAALLTGAFEGLCERTACDRPLHCSISYRDKTRSRPHALR